MEEEQRHLEILQQQLLHEQAMLLVRIHPRNSNTGFPSKEFSFGGGLLLRVVNPPLYTHTHFIGEIGTFTGPLAMMMSSAGN